MTNDGGAVFPLLHPPSPIPHPLSPIPGPLLPISFNSHLQWHSYDLLLVLELAPELVAARLRKRVYETDIGAIHHAGGQDAAGGHWANRVDMRKNSAGGIARDHVAAHAQPGLQ